MKRLLAIIGIASIFAFQACEGPMGPPGPPGLDGLDGVNIVGEAFEVEITFNEANNYGEVFDFTQPLVDGDALLVYMLEASPLDENVFAWRLLPQTFYLEQGILVYNFDYTVNDFSIFLDNSPIDFSSLDPYYTDNLLFRVVVIPSDLQSRIDYTDYEAVMKMLGIEEDDFVKLSPKVKQ